MRHAICLLTLVIVSGTISYLSVIYNLSPIVYFSASLAAGAVLGYISGKAGYEA